MPATTGSALISPSNVLVTSEAVSRASVSAVRSILLSLEVPMELVLRIMDMAEYRPTLRTERPNKVSIAAGGHAWDTEACWAAKLYLVSGPLLRSPEDVFWKVHKPNLAGEYAGAKSWYEACIFRPRQADEVVNVTQIDGIYRTFSDPQQGMLAVQALLGAAGWTMVSHGGELTWRLQNNRVAHDKYIRHVVEWSIDQPRGITEEEEPLGAFAGDGFVEALQPGDRVGIWMRAKHAGWECHTKAASVGIVYEFR
uniref:Vacuolar protein-sorting-associated protein 4 n=1 Tax=Ganoderma boninense TaxID=34458 RepID=A0A5K1K496_9APHY|nr:Vacuolar protein-sorting-associated protein 4 [Ganoderma boninense]